MRKCPNYTNMDQPSHHTIPTSHISENRKWCRQTGSPQSTPYRRHGTDTESQYRPGSSTDPKPSKETQPRVTSQCRVLFTRFSVDPTSSIRSRLRTPFVLTPFQRAPNPPEFAQPGLSKKQTEVVVFVLCHLDLLKWGCESSGGFGTR